MATPKKTGRPPLPDEAWPVFLESYEGTGNVRASAALAGLSVRTVYRWMADDSEKREQFDSAREALVGDLESTLYRIAVSGTDVTALIFALKSWRPGVYNRAPQPNPLPAGDAQSPQPCVIQIVDPGADARQELVNRLAQQSRRMESQGTV